MIDTHAHLKNREKLLVDSLQWVILSASSVEDSRENIILAKTNSKLLASVGIHPQTEIRNVELSPKGTSEGAGIRNLDELLNNNNIIIAVGECGLDFSEEHDKLMQEELFVGQIELAIKYKKPLIVHSRKAMDETLLVLTRYQNLRGVIHCYTGGVKRIKKVLEMPGDWYFGIDGNLTYETGLVEVVKNIPKDRLVLETDSPFLTPVPHRGEKNQPEYVRFVYQKMADIWGISFEETEKIIDQNAKNLFGI